jgi:hypothetical protein
VQGIDFEAEMGKKYIPASQIDAFYNQLLLPNVT